MPSINESSTLAKKISSIIDFIKDNEEITLKEIEQQTKLQQLSKAKNPNYVLKTRSKILETLLSFYNLELADNDSISKRPENANENIYYIIYYYLKEKRIVKKGILKVKKWDQVEASFFNIDYSITEINWKGSYHIIESNTFIFLEKKGASENEATPIKSLMCMYSGTEKVNHQYLIGTYSAVRKNNIPTAGKVLLEKVESLETAKQTLKHPTAPLIERFLYDTNIIGETITPDKVIELPVSYLPTKFIGTYKIFYLQNQALVQDGLIIQESNVVRCQLRHKNLEGQAVILSSTSLRFDLRLPDLEEILPDINSTIYLSSVGFWLIGICLTTGIDGLPQAFPIIMVEEEKNVQEEKISSYLATHSTVSLSFPN